LRATQKKSKKIRLNGRRWLTGKERLKNARKKGRHENRGTRIVGRSWNPGAKGKNNSKVLTLDELRIPTETSRAKRSSTGQATFLTKEEEKNQYGK